jgi:hypothetical protein
MTFIGTTLIFFDGKIRDGNSHQHKGQGRLPVKLQALSLDRSEKIKQHTSLLFCLNLTAAFEHNMASEHNPRPMYGSGVQLYF